MTVYVLALLSPLAFALGTVLQQRGTLQTPAREGDPRFLGQVIRKPVWYVGGLVTVVGFVLQAAALHYGSLTLVQALQVLSLVFALPLGVALTAQRLTWCSYVGACLTVIGLVVFVALGEPQGGLSQPPGEAWAVAGALTVATTAVLTWLGLIRRGSAAAAFFGTAAGIFFALQAGVTKVLVGELGSGLTAVLTSWSLYALILTAAAGFVLEQMSLKTGALPPAMASLSAATLAISVLIGVTVFQETISEGGGGAFVAIAGLMLAIAGVVLLAQGCRQPQRKWPFGAKTP